MRGAVALVLAVLAGRGGLVASQEPGAASGVTFKQGKGDPRTSHPDGKTQVERDWLKDSTGQARAKLTRGPCETVACFSFSADGKLLAVGIRYDSFTGSRSGNGTIRGYVRVYDTGTGDLVKDSGPGTIGPVEHVAFSREGDVVLYQTGKYEEHGGK
jgi:hypothetical protein